MINSSKKASFSWLQAYLMTLWHQHLSPTLHITLQKVCLWFIVNLESLQFPFKDKSFLLQVSRKIDQVQKWSEPHIETLNSVSFVLTAHLFTFHVLKYWYLRTFTEMDSKHQRCMCDINYISRTKSSIFNR